MEPSVVAEFATPEELLRALRGLRTAGYANLDAYTPYPVDGVASTLRLGRSPLTWIVLPFALFGGVGAYLVQWACNAVDYPLNVGGRPAHSAPAFIPITFEMTVLFAGLATFVSLFALAGLPRLSQRLFGVVGFDRASRDRFWVGVSPVDKTDERVARTLRELGAARVVYLREEQER